MKKLILILCLAVLGLLAQGQGSGDPYFRGLVGMEKVGTDTMATIKMFILGTDTMTSTTRVDALDTTLATKRYVDLYSGSSIGIQDSLLFLKDIAGLVHEEGKMYYDSISQSWVLFSTFPDVALNVGEELWSEIVHNNTGADILDGTIVHIDTAIAGKFHIALSEKSIFEKSRLLGVATHDIANGDSGRVTLFGTVNHTYAGLSSGYVYLGDAGVPTNTKPSGGDWANLIGYYNSDAGKLFVRPSITQYTDELIKAYGFPDYQETYTNITFNPATREFKIMPVGDDFYVYQEGTKYITTGDSVTITDVEGVHVIYYDAGELISYANPSSSEVEEVIKTKVVVSYVYWDATANDYYYLANERHTFHMDKWVHAYLHQAFGTRYVSGLDVDVINTAGTGALDADAQFSLSNGVVTDEDVPTVTPSLGLTSTIPYFYKGSTYWRRDSLLNFSFPVGTTPLPVYNNTATGALTEITSGNFVLNYIFAINDNRDNNKVIAIVGQQQYSSLADAQVAAQTGTELLELPELFAETKHLYTLIIEGKTSFTNSVQARYRACLHPVTGESVDFVDYRSFTAGGGGGTSGTGSSTLLGLTDVLESSYVSSAGNVVKVNSGETGVEFGVVDTLASNINRTNFISFVNNNISGAITPPGSSTDNAVVRFNGTSGSSIQNSNTTVDDDGNLNVNNAPSTGTAFIEVAGSRTGDGISFIDLVGSSGTYGDYGLRLIRNAGSSGTGSLIYNGIGSLNITTQTSTPINFQTSGLTQMSLSGSVLDLSSVDLELDEDLIDIDGSAGTAGYVLSSLGSGNGVRWISGGGSMVYPGAGIAISTGSAWGTSITDNSTNWNTAYGWGDHSTEGYLTSVDIPDINATGTPSSSTYLRGDGTWSSVAGGGDMTKAVYDANENNIIDVIRGGTGFSSYTTGDLIYASGTLTLGKLNAGTNGYVLTSNGAGTAPSWQAASAGGASQLSDLTDVNTSTPTSGRLLIADGTDFESVAVSGDATLASTGALTLTPSAITNKGVNVSPADDDKLLIQDFSGGDLDYLSLSTLKTYIGSGGGMVYPGAGIPVSTGSAWTTSKTAPAGTIVGTSDTQTLTNKTLTAASNTITGLGVTNLGGITGTPSSSTYLRGDGQWGTISAGSGDVTAADSPLSTQIPVWRSATSIGGDADFLWDGDEMFVGTTTDNGNYSMHVGTQSTANGSAYFEGDISTLRQLNQVNAITDQTSNFTVDAAAGDVHTLKLTKTGGIIITIHNAVAGAQGTIFIYDVSGFGTPTVTAYSDAGTTGLDEVTLGGTPTGTAAKFISLTYTATGQNEDGAIGNEIYLVWNQEN